MSTTRRRHTRMRLKSARPKCSPRTPSGWVWHSTFRSSITRSSIHPRKPANSLNRSVSNLTNSCFFFFLSFTPNFPRHFRFLHIPFVLSLFNLFVCVDSIPLIPGRNLLYWTGYLSPVPHLCFPLTSTTTSASKNPTRIPQRRSGRLAAILPGSIWSGTLQDAAYPPDQARTSPQLFCLLLRDPQFAWSGLSSS